MHERFLAKYLGEKSDKMVSHFLSLFFDRALCIHISYKCTTCASD